MPNSQNWFVLALILLSGWLIYLLSPILMPFVLSAVLAYLGDPQGPSLVRPWLRDHRPAVRDAALRVCAGASDQRTRQQVLRRLAEGDAVPLASVLRHAIDHYRLDPEYEAEVAPFLTPPELPDPSPPAVPES